MKKMNIEQSSSSHLSEDEFNDEMREELIQKIDYLSIP
jgi:hypothetical protein